MEISRQAANVNPKLNYSMVGKENDMMMLGGLVSKKSGIDLMQNCDLPPPLKVFTGFDKALVSTNTKVVYSIMGQEDDKDDDDGKLEIFKALRLSQTRAREAERKAVGLAEEKQRISNALMKDSLQLSAYRQWVRLLEIQVWVLKSEMVKIENNWCDKSEGEEDGNIGDDMSSIVAVAICLGIATVGFVSIVYPQIGQAFT